ncbi:hypothetical protein APS_0921 [Acetobacter pasteurianus subsp. pasteurianus LMG 1262 = NBRC 106471]|nr:hypothetical protein APS_0921 [Acetobacter pasteurianus subsp. pasteurianus LMG 1262 = NBRC 106471]
MDKADLQRPQGRYHWPEYEVKYAAKAKRSFCYGPPRTLPGGP